MRMQERAVWSRACLLVFLFSSAAQACLWDRDTLATEASKIPDVVNVLVGRFERNPPLYYKVRLERVKASLLSNPSDLPAYDDAAVACDRLGNDEQAIQFMEAKRKQLDTTSSPDKEEQTYRYHANLGTFYVHRWLSSGADRKNMTLVKQAHDEIAEAIHLNPNAHFGRERYQLMAIDWILDPKSIHLEELKPESRPESETFLPREVQALAIALPHEDGAERLTQLGYGDAAKGLSGLIVLGSAWESVDVFNALYQVMRIQFRYRTAFLVKLRMKELSDNGKRSLFPEQTKVEAPFLKSLMVNSLLNADENREALAAYATLRANARVWEKNRTTFMMSRLYEGRHPDTDKTFWDGYVELKETEFTTTQTPNTKSGLR